MNLTRVVRNIVGATVLAGSLLLSPAVHAQVYAAVGIAPPAIPVYGQPPCPGYGYIWTPGYWAYGPQGYVWVEGAWVVPPYEGALWTPGYWGGGDDGYFWSPGYWGLNVGYYGGINYGFGYFGTGFYGGYWRGGRLFYNAEYNHFGFRGYDGFIYHQRFGAFDGRPGGAAFARGYDRGRSFDRGSSVNGRSFAGVNRGSEQGGFRNGYTGSGARPAYNGGARGYNPAVNQQMGNGYAAGQARGFQGGNQSFGGRSSGYSGAQAQAYAGRNFGAQSRTSYSAPAASQSRSYGGGNFSSGARPNFSSGGGGGFHGGGGGGGGSFHGGGGGGHR